jgi:hypothetical protein
VRPMNVCGNSCESFDVQNVHFEMETKAEERDPCGEIIKLKVVWPTLEIE